MTIRKLKELLENLPDDMRIYADDGSSGMFSDNNEFLTVITQKDNKVMCVLQTRNDFETDVELDAWCDWAMEHHVDEQDFWIEFSECGYLPADFHDKDRKAWAENSLKTYGLM